MGERAAKVKEAIGWATGDRKVEAEGRVEAEVADPANPRSEVTDQDVGAETDAVREEHGEFNVDRAKERPADRP